MTADIAAVADTRVRRRFEKSRVAVEEFFAGHAHEVGRACLEMARRFDRGGRLLVLGERAAASDAHHVAVEFVHPVLVGKRALPALALTAPLHDGETGWVDRLAPIMREKDIVLAISHGPATAAMLRALERSRAHGALTFALTGDGIIPAVPAVFLFRVSSADTLVVQEVQETLYHVFWELVHVFIGASNASTADATCLPDANGHCSVCGDEALPGVILALDDRARSAVVAIAGAEREVAMDLVASPRIGDTVMVHQGFAITALETAPAQPLDVTRALYPFLYDERPNARSVDSALAEVRASTLEKCREVVLLRDALQRAYDAVFPQCATAMAARFARGGKLLAFGNGGSATDAEDVEADCRYVAHHEWKPLPALALTADVAVLSAIANDAGFESVFARQVIAFGDAADIALGISTSGNSPNVLAALREAKRRGLLTVALSGDEGGELARAGVADFCFVARSTHIPRIQEGQATVWHTLLELVQARLA